MKKSLRAYWKNAEMHDKIIQIIFTFILYFSIIRLFICMYFTHAAVVRLILDDTHIYRMIYRYRTYFLAAGFWKQVVNTELMWRTRCLFTHPAVAEQH